MLINDQQIWVKQAYKRKKTIGLMKISDAWENSDLSTMVQNGSYQGLKRMQGNK